MLNQYKHISKLSQHLLSLFSIDEIKNLMDNQLVTSYFLNNKPYFYKPTELEEELLKFIKQKKQIKIEVLPVLCEKYTAEYPNELEGIKHKLVYFNNHFISAVYFLCKNNKVVYVGQAVNVSRRVGDHLNVKDFDTIFYLPTPKDQLSEIERNFIKLLRPIFNIQGIINKP